MSEPGTPCSRGRDPHLTPRGKPACKGHNRRTGKCCQADPAPGQAVCHWHGAGTPQAKRAAEIRIDITRREREMTAAVATLGLAREVDPTQALLEEVHWTAGHVAWLRQRVQELDEDDLTWGETASVHKGSGEFPGTDTTSEAKPSIWYLLYERERDRLVKVCEAALKAGVAERQVRLAEQQGMLVAGGIRRILDRMQTQLLLLLRGLGVPEDVMVAQVTAAWPEWVATIVPEELRAIAAQPVVKGEVL